MEEETWKAVEGYEDYYEVSSYGRVRGVDRVIINSDGVKRLWKGRILRPGKNTEGYLTCVLYKNSKHKTLKVHRLVAEAFLPNPDNLPVINHKDENKTNNRVFLNKDDSVDFTKSNLEWCDGKYNSNYGTAIQRSTEKRSKPVLQIDLETNQIVDEYSSTQEAARQTGFSQGNISNCCNGKLKTYKCFKWRYKE